MSTLPSLAKRRSRTHNSHNSPNAEVNFRIKQQAPPSLSRPARCMMARRVGTTHNTRTHTAFVDCGFNPIARSFLPFNLRAERRLRHVAEMAQTNSLSARCRPVHQAGM